MQRLHHLVLLLRDLAGQALLNGQLMTLVIVVSLLVVALLATATQVVAPFIYAIF